MSGYCDQIELKTILDNLDQPLEAGQTIRLSHENCYDTRRRLYVTRVLADPTKVVSFCHNCQGSAVYTDRDNTPYRNARHMDSTTALTMPVEYDEDGTVVPPTGMLSEVEEWPTYAKTWAWKNRLYGRICKRYGIQFDPNTNRIYLPRFRTINRHRDDPTVGHTLTGYQLRAVAKGDTPKYLTCIADDSVSQWTRIIGGLDTAMAVIVEDLASGINIMEAYMAAGAKPPDVLVNYGVKVDPTLMYTAAKAYLTVLVWLDNDSILVKNQAKLMARTMELYGINRAIVVEDYSDPKHYDADKIGAIIGDMSG